MSPFAGVSIASRDGRTWERKNPSVFWMLLLLGSVGLHGGSFLLVPSWWRSRQPQPQASNPLPIEVVELAEPPGIGTAAPVAPTAPATEPNLQPQFTQPGVAPPPPARNFPFPTTQPQPAPAPLPQPAPQPTNDPVPEQSPAPSSPTPTQPPQPVEPPQPIEGSPIPDPVAPPVESPPPVTPPFPNTGVNPGASDPLTGTDPGAGGDSGEQGRGVGGTGDDLADVPVPGESTPTEITANLLEVLELPPEQLQDIPDVYPQPLANSQTVVADPTDTRYCPVLPESFQAFGQEVTLRLIIGLDGGVQNAIVQSPSSVPAYDELARCLVQNYWTFQPATIEDIPVASDSLVVTIVLQ
ncbi:MAG: energy transducer TonB [Cyanobacteria bacterium J06638_22]